MTEDAKPEPKLPPTHDSHGTRTRVLDENQVDHEQLKAKLAGKIKSIGFEYKQTVMKAEREHVVDVLKILRDDPELDYKMITDITAVDNMRRPDFEPARRFTLIHTVYSISNRKRVRIESDIPEADPRTRSAHGIYKGAAWIEREVYDMFGITFDGHPNLKRVLMPDYYEHFPLRKDYPLTGRGERDNFVRAEELS